MYTPCRLSLPAGATPGGATPSEAVPITLDEAIGHLRINAGDEDDYVTGLIDVVQGSFERETDRQLLTQTWIAYFNGFPPGREPIRLPKRPLQSVTEIRYRDADGLSTVWDDAEYRVTAYRGSLASYGTIQPTVGFDYPSTEQGAEVVEVEFVAGYGDEAADIPADIKNALLLLLAHGFQNRFPFTTTGDLPVSLKGILSHYRGALIA